MVPITKIQKATGHGTATLVNCANYMRQVCVDAVFGEGTVSGRQEVGEVVIGRNKIGGLNRIVEKKM